MAPRKEDAPKAVKKAQVQAQAEAKSEVKEVQEKSVPSTMEVIAFAKKLASNKKDEREQTLLAMRAWLKAREKAAGAFEEIELLKLWKGLFYCLWMSDKVAVQQQLAEDLAALVHVFKKKANTAIFIRAFYKTMLREWPGLDKWRVDKFYSLVRYLFRETLVWMQKRSCLELWGCVLRDDLLLHKPNGLRLHMADIFLDEVFATETDSKLSAEELQELLSPFYCVLGCCDSDAVVRHVLKVVFAPLLEDRPMANLDLKTVAQSIFAIAADAEDVSDTQRDMLYDTYSDFRSKIGGAVGDTLVVEDHDEDDDDADAMDTEDVEAEDDDDDDEEEEEEDLEEEVDTDEAHRDLMQEFEQMGEDGSDEEEEEAAVEQAKKEARATPKKKAAASTPVSSKKSTKKAKASEAKAQSASEAVDDADADAVASSPAASAKKSKKVKTSKPETPQSKKKSKRDAAVPVKEDLEAEDDMASPARGKNVVAEVILTPEQNTSSDGSSSSKKKNTKTKKSTSKKDIGLPPVPDNKTNSAKKRIRFALESTQSLDHRVSMKRLKTTPVKPASKATAPLTGLLKVTSTPETTKGGKRATQTEKKPRSTLKQGLAAARKNTILNSAPKPRRREQRARAEDFF